MFSNPGSAFKNKVFLILGGSRGIGEECALQLVRLGARAAIVGRDADAINAGVVKLRQAADDPDKVIGWQADLSSVDQIHAAVEGVCRHFGRIDVLINSAGANIRTKAADVTEDEWDALMDVNLKGAFFAAQAFARTVQDGRCGKIINISSQYGHIGSSTRVVYCSSKGGLELMTKSLAVEWAPKILVNNVCPTFIQTDLTKTLLEQPETKQQLLDRMPLHKLGSVHDVAGAVLYLASDLSNMVTGTSLMVDGGWTAC